ncbi:hypothetical protein LTR95_004552 [Oleoguttula sp. CCFEE 5521]
MPKLKQITCSLELAPNDVKLKEYDQRFRDGAVECFVAVPEAPIPFSVHMHTHGWIASGMAMFIFIDGVYQCNRNKRCPGVLGVSETDSYDIDFRVRQREEKMADSSFIGREWMFQALKLAEADGSPTVKPTQERDIGTIEVVVLRCNYEPKSGTATKQPPPVRPTKAASVAKAPSKAPSARASSAGFGGMMGLFDGAGDEPPSAPQIMHFDSIMGAWVSASVVGSQHDDRSAVHQQYGADRVHTVDNTPSDGKQQDSGLTLDGQGFQGYSAPPPAFNVGAQHYGLQGYAPHVGYDDTARKRQALLDSGASLPPQPDFHDAPMPFAATQPQGYPQHLRQAAYQPHHAPQGFTHGAMPAYYNSQRPTGQSHYGRGDIPTHGGMAHANKPFAVRSRDDRLRGPSAPQVFPADDVEGGVEPFVSIPGQPISKTRIPPEHQVQMIMQLPSERLDPYGIDRGLYAAGARYIPCLDHIRATDLQRVQLPHIATMLDSFRYYGQFPDGTPAIPITFSTAMPAYGQPEEQIFASGASKGGWPDVRQGNPSAPAPIAAAHVPNAPAPSAADNKSGANTHEHFTTPSKQGGNGGWEDAPTANAKPDNAWETKPEGNGTAPAWGESGDQNNAGGNHSWGNDAGDQNNTTGEAGDWGGDNGNKNDGIGDGWGDNNAAPKSKSNTGNAWGSGSQHPSQAARSVRSAATAATYDPQAHIKPYWVDWQKPQATSTGDNQSGFRRETAREVYNYPAPPVPTVSANDKRDASHGVHVGRGAEYSHKTYRPAYIDAMDEPYAVFTFKYRSRERLEQILGRRIEKECARVEEEVQKGTLLAMPKEELVKQLMAMKSPSSAHKTSSKAPSVQQDWGSGSKQGGEAPAANNAWDAPQESGKSQAGGKGGAWGVVESAPANDATWGATSGNKPPSTHSKQNDNGWNQTGEGQTGGGGWGVTDATDNRTKTQDTPTRRGKAPPRTPAPAHAAEQATTGNRTRHIDAKTAAHAILGVGNQATKGAAPPSNLQWNAAGNGGDAAASPGGFAAVESTKGAAGNTLW